MGNLSRQKPNQTVNCIICDYYMWNDNYKPICVPCEINFEAGKTYCKQETIVIDRRIAGSRHFPRMTQI